MGQLDDLRFVHSDQRSKQGQSGIAAGEVQALHGLAGHLAEALSGNKTIILVQMSQAIGDRQHCGSYQ